MFVKMLRATNQADVRGEVRVRDVGEVVEVSESDAQHLTFYGKAEETTAPKSASKQAPKPDKAK